MSLTLPARIEPVALAALSRAVAALEHGQVAVLRSADADTFCLGMDLEGYARVDLRQMAAPLHAYGQLLLALHRAPCPTIAVVEGAAVGGGLGLAAVCDVVLVAPNARFGLPEATFGLVPGMVQAVMAPRISASRFRQMALLGDSIDGQTALAWGLADAPVRVADLDRTVRRWTRRLSRLAPGAVQRVRQAACPDLAADLDRGCGLTTGLLELPDVQARVRRFALEGVAPWLPRDGAP